MNLLILILCVLVECFATVSGQCGQIPNAKMRPNPKRGQENRIVGGVEARPHSHPWIISIQNEDGAHFCGGSLVRVGPMNRSDIVISAAHCAYDAAVPYEVSAGAHNLKTPPSGQQNILVAKYVSHPNYDPDKTLHDITIIKLAKPIDFSSTVQPVCLPEVGEQVANNLEGTVAGWGLTKESGKATSDILMQVGVPTVSHKDCVAYYKRAAIFIDENAMLCAGYKQGGQDSCQGDSGGPLIFKTDKTYVLQGVVSFGQGCARKGFPGVFARVSHYIPWINEQIKALSDVK